MSTFGHTSAGPTINGQPSATALWLYGPFSPASDGTLEALSIYIENVRSSTKAQLAVYTGSATTPDSGSFVAQTGDISTALGLISGDTLTNPSVFAATNYWIAVECDSDFDTWKVQGVGLGFVFERTSAYGTWPSTLSSPSPSLISTQVAESIYATYAPPGTITVTPSTLPNGVKSTSYSQTVAANGGTGPYTFSRAFGVFPTGLSLSSGGVLSGTPSALGTFNFTIAAVDTITPFASGSTSYTVTIYALTVSPSTLPDWTIGVAYSQTITASGGTGPYTFAVTSGSLPTGLSLASGGAITGTTSASGTFTFTVTATDSLSATGARDYTIVVHVAVTVITTNLADGFINEAYSQSVTATGGIGPYTYAVTSGALPNGLSLSSGGAITGTPTVVGIFTFTVTATDTVDATASKSLEIDVIFTFRNSTTHFRVYYNSSTLPGAAGTNAADGVLATCETEYAQQQTYFGGFDPAAAVPISVLIATVPAAGSIHSGLEVNLNAFSGNIAKTRFTLVAELVEIFEQTQLIGWDANGSNGEGLSRVIATDVDPTQLNADGVNFTSAAFWLDNGRPNWVDTTEGTDANRLSYGCATLFLNYLHYMLGYSWVTIIAAGASTLAQTYTNLTGRSDGWVAFKAMMDSRIPIPAPASFGLATSDNPFPLAKASAMLIGQF